MASVNRARDAFAATVRRTAEQRVGNAQALQRAMDKAFEKLGEQAKAVIVNILLEEFSQLQAATPYDTGRAQAGWLISGEGASWSFVPAEGQAQYHPQAPNLGSLMRSDVIFVINNVEYILFLEAGWSKRQPGGFVAAFLANCKRRIATECAALSRVR